MATTCAGSFYEETAEIVFHAAAYKHVGMMELHPDQAIRNNVLGTSNVLLAAIEAGVETFVNVSTDKSVNPRCFMGLSEKAGRIAGERHRAAQRPALYERAFRQRRG